MQGEELFYECAARSAQPLPRIRGHFLLHPAFAGTRADHDRRTGSPLASSIDRLRTGRGGAVFSLHLLQSQAPLLLASISLYTSLYRQIHVMNSHLKFLPLLASPCLQGEGDRRQPVEGFLRGAKWLRKGSEQSRAPFRSGKPITFPCQGKEISSHQFSVFRLVYKDMACEVGGDRHQTVSKQSSPPRLRGGGDQRQLSLSRRSFQRQLSLSRRSFQRRRMGWCLSGAFKYSAVVTTRRDSVTMGWCLSIALPSPHHPNLPPQHPLKKPLRLFRSRMLDHVFRCALLQNFSIGQEPELIRDLSCEADFMGH